MPVSNNFEIFCQDAVAWLAAQKDHSLGNVITGIPDLDETPYNETQYVGFLSKVALQIFKKVKKDGYCIFMNTDRKFEKKWIDKAFLIQEMAKKAGISLRWHKIILLRPVNSAHLQRPTYQHFLCFSYNSGPGEATADTIFCGQKSYKNASCPVGIEHSLNFLKRYSPYQFIVDPFVGRGTVLKMAKDKRVVESLYEKAGQLSH